tara:strand:+ start:152347 stop:154599 length:2253 start_codon:yes stop_codon:yes gene_type:complete
MRNFSCTALAAFILTLYIQAQAKAAEDYPAAVKAVVEQRCMVCHGCYDAPCQLKLDAWAGLQRGANKTKVYDGTRLLTANLTRLFEDAQTTEQWRDKDFYPVLPEGESDINVISGMLQLKRDHPLPRTEQLPDSFDFNLDRDQQCPQPDEFDRFAQDFPLWGMPYGFPGLQQEEHDTLTDWLNGGAQGVATAAPSAKLLDAVARWESFLNGPSLKQQLMSRYIYEHLFIGNLYFSELPANTGYFKLVRSRTPPGQPVDIIATRRPYDSPGKGPFFYRLSPMKFSVLDKRHMPYAINEARMRRWQSLFIDAPYTVSELPSYKTNIASNPFVVFREMPVKSRYRFMLDEAQFTIMGYIKGPVCRGQVALNVINDHFWVMFTDPDNVDPDHDANFLAAKSDKLRLPSGKSNLLISLVEWKTFSRDQLDFLEAKADFIDQRLATDDLRIDMDIIWDGEGHNDNAALTVFRHLDSATVVKGFVGQQPKTAWVIDYSLLERIHYLLVAGFDVYGNVGHQLETRLYMDFLRMEGEQNFLMLLPRDQRVALRDFWYRGASEDTKNYVLGDSAAFDRETDIVFTTDDPKGELLHRLQDRLPRADAARYNKVHSAFDRLNTLTGKPFSLMPEVSFVDVLDGRGEHQIFTIVHNSGHSNNAQIFNEDERRIPEEDYLTVVRGFIGSYPNIFFQLPERDLPAFVKTIEGMRSEQDYARLVSSYGVRRTAPWFWKLSDTFHQHYRDNHPIEAGLFDLNRYENR